MDDLKRVSAVQDESCHWYVIPFESEDEFYRLSESEEHEEEFIEKFSEYRTGGALNNIELYAKL